MPKLIDMTGLVFGRLTVTGKAEPDGNGLTRWTCLCSCGTSVTVRGQDLRRGRQQSCGCQKAEKTARRNYKHGQKGTRLHRIWKNMKSRCYNPSVPSFKDYGARGIVLCDEWRESFAAFYQWATENGYSDDKSIDRIDVNGNYCPANCRWVTRAEQSRNTRQNHLIPTPWGLMCLTDAAKKAGISLSCLKQRLKSGVPEDQLLTKGGERREGTV